VGLYPQRGVWTQQGPKLVGTGAAGNANQGWSVAISGDGNTAIVGGRSDNSNAGAAWVYTRSNGGIWTQQGSKLVGTGAVGNVSAQSTRHAQPQPLRGDASVEERRCCAIVRSRCRIAT
jgi:hypothetical protein